MVNTKIKLVLFFISIVNSSSALHSSRETFQKFDANHDQRLSRDEFSTLLSELLHPEQQYRSKSIWDRFHDEAAVAMNETEFQLKIWRPLLAPLVSGDLSSSGLLLIDIQNDFVSGSLAVEGAEDVIAPNNALLDGLDFRATVYSLDWHPQNHVSFWSNAKLRPRLNEEEEEDPEMFDTVTFLGPPPFNQTLWPDHCVQGSQGARLHPHLKVIPEALYVRKGTNPEVDSYSAFFDNLSGGDTGLRGLLRDRGVTNVFVTGLATDYCVSATAKHALELGLPTFLVLDATRGVDEASSEAEVRNVVEKGGIIVQSRHLLKSQASSSSSSSIALPVGFLCLFFAAVSS